MTLILPLGAAGFVFVGSENVYVPAVSNVYSACIPKRYGPIGEKNLIIAVLDK